MEKKQLDFNQPLLTARRFSPTASTSEADNKRNAGDNLRRMPHLPVYKSELKSGPVRNPGNVPFVWEKTPGRPKDESKPTTLTIQRPPVVPKLPPGRNLDAKPLGSEKGLEGTATGRPQPKKGLPCSQKFPSLDKHVTKEESSKEGMEETGNSSSESADDAYVDALDTLSRSESFFLNCSISGVSGVDDPYGKPSITFSTDPDARDFMMGRFLPAAKAMASETPQLSTRKQLAAREQPRQLNKVVSVEKQHPRNQYRLNNIPQHAQRTGLEESDDEDEDCEVPDNSSLKVCGLFPRLCLQNSFCLLNPATGMRKPPLASISSVRTTKGVKFSYASSCGKTENEHYRSAECERLSRKGPQTLGGHENKNQLGSGLPPIDNQCFQSGILEEKAYAGIPEKTKNFGVTGFNPHGNGGSNFGELLAKESYEWESSSASPALEKTLYIDSVHVVKSRNSNSSSSDLKGLIEYNGDNVETLVKNRGIEETAAVNSSLQDVEEKSLPECMESVDSCFTSLSEKSTDNVKMAVVEASEHDQDLLQESISLTSSKKDNDGRLEFSEGPLNRKSDGIGSYHGVIEDSNILTNGKVTSNGKIGLESQFYTKLSDQDTSDGSCALLPLPPPLPKSPSESWLTRTLPTVSFRNSSSRSSLGTRVHPGVHASNVRSLNSKWETIVRSTNAQHGHLRFSEELLTPIPET